jgi:hypothetical protein
MEHNHSHGKNHVKGSKSRLLALFSGLFGEVEVVSRIVRVDEEIWERCNVWSTALDGFRFVETMSYV